MPGNTQEEKLDILSNFIIQSKVEAFTEAYKPANDCGGLYDETIEAFTDARLRKFFNAYPKPCGDPLSIYIDEHLRKLGFHFSVMPESPDEPVMLVRRKFN